MTRGSIQLSAAVLVMTVTAAGSGTTLAEDWPQWRGPSRNGISQETGLLKQWPQEGPELAWQVEGLGDGYGAPSVADGTIYLVVNEGLEKESVVALRETDGSELWSTQIGKVGNPKQKPNYPAARSTPTVAGDLVYALGSDGDLVCLETETGDIRWKKSLRTDFGGKPGTWAYAESPLVDGDVVVVAPGSEKAALVALNRNNGETIWQAEVPGSDEAGYASIVIADVGGVKQYIAFLGIGLVGVDAETGKFLWVYEPTASIANSPTPVVRGDSVYSGSGRAGGALVRLKPEGDEVNVEEVYFSQKLPNAQGGFVVVGDYLYGGAGPTLMCIDFASGEVQWEERVPAPVSICYADDRLYLHAQNGDVLLVEASPEEYRERGRFTPADRPPSDRSKAWAYPVVANGRLYIRERGTLWSYRIE